MNEAERKLKENLIQLTELTRDTFKDVDSRLDSVFIYIRILFIILSISAGMSITLFIERILK